MIRVAKSKNSIFKKSGHLESKFHQFFNIQYSQLPKTSQNVTHLEAKLKTKFFF